MKQSLSILRREIHTGAEHTKPSGAANLRSKGEHMDIYVNSGWKVFDFTIEGVRWYYVSRIDQKGIYFASTKLSDAIKVCNIYSDMVSEPYTQEE